MFKVYLRLILLSLFFYSCSKQKLDAPEAIKELISKNTSCTCEPYIDQYFWRGQTVYVLASKGPACDSRPVYYNENGEEFNMDLGYTFESFRQEGHFVKNIWTCKW